MRLLPKDKAKGMIDDFRAALVEERNALTSEITRLTKEKNDLRSSFDEEKRKVLTEHDELMKRTARERQDLLNETLSLEERKKESLKPISDRVQRAEEAEKRAKEQQEAVLSMARKFGEEKSAFVERLASVVDRENVLREQEESVLYRLDRLRESELLNKASTDALSAKWLDFRAKNEEKQKEYETREAQIALAKAEIEKDRTWLSQERKEIETLRAKTYSERQALKAAFDEGRKKGIL